MVIQTLMAGKYLLLEMMEALKESVAGFVLCYTFPSFLFLLNSIKFYANEKENHSAIFGILPSTVFFFFLLSSVDLLIKGRFYERAFNHDHLTSFNPQ